MSRRTVDVLADWAASARSDDVEVATLEAARASLLDLIGAAAAGYDVPAAVAVRDYATDAFGAGPSTVWFADRRVGAPAAALANSAAAAALDVDDGHRLASGHPGAAVMPAALAAAEACGSTGNDVLTAIIVGYEVAVRAGAAFRLGPKDTISTGHWCSIGAAAAAGRVAGLGPPELASAMSTAAAFAPRLVELGVEAHDVKEGIAWSTHAGVVAADLARRGFAGPREVLDQRTYDQERLLDGLGRDRPLIETAYLKPYGSCRWSHAAIDASLDLARDHGLTPADIESITIETFGRAATLFNETDPRTLEAAQYSVPFCVAVAIARGAEALLPLRGELLGQPDIVDISRRTEVRVAPDLDRQFPAAVPARVTMRTPLGTVSELVETPRGDPANPLSREERIAKYRALTQARLSRDQSRSILEAIDTIESTTSVDILTRHLAPGGALARASVG